MISLMQVGKLAEVPVQQLCIEHFLCAELDWALDAEHSMLNLEIPITSSCLLGFLRELCARSRHPIGDGKLPYRNEGG